MNVESNAAKPAAPTSAQNAGSTLTNPKSGVRAAGLPGVFSEMLNQARDAEVSATEPDDKASPGDEPVRNESRTSGEDTEVSAGDDNTASADTPSAAPPRSETAAPRVEAQTTRVEASVVAGEKGVTPGEIRKAAGADDLRKGASNLDPKAARESIDPATLTAAAGASAGATTAVQTTGARSSAARIARADQEAGSAARLADQRDEEGTTSLSARLEGQNKASGVGNLQPAAGMAGSRDPAHADSTNRLLSEFAALELKSIDGKSHARDSDSSNLLTLPQTLSSGSLSAIDTGSNQPLLAARAEPTYSIAAPPGTLAFTESLASHLGNMTTNSLDRAEIQLNPRELGPIRIEISVKDKETSIVLTASQPMTMAALEQGTATLRTLLADQGLNLRQLDIQSGGNSQGQPSMSGERHGSQDSGSRRERAGGDQGFVAGPVLNDGSRAPSHRLLDLFA